MGSAPGPVSPAGVAARPSAGNPSRPPGRVPALDGLRGLALIAVLAYHVAPNAAPGGFLGVESFFVLSGFLLTTLLVAEHGRSGTIAFGRYAERRARRIAPALLVLLIVLVVVGPIVARADAHRLAGDVLSSLAGATNWHLIADASSYFDQGGRPSFVRHLWSVAVEVQFYALCPFLVAWLCRRRRRVALATLAVGITLSAMAMAALYQGGDPSRAYYGTDTRAGALLSGALLAMVLAKSGAFPRTGVGARHAAVILGPLAMLALVALFVFADDRARWSYPTAFLATQAVTAGLIVAGLQAGPTSRLLGARSLRWLGVRSFGIYLWHWPAVVLLRPGIDVDWPPAVAAAVGIAFAVVLGAVSYSVVERPWLRRRRDPAQTVRRPAMAVAATAIAVGLAGLLLRLPTTDPLAETLRDGETILAAQLPPSTAPTTSVVPSTLAPSTTQVPVTEVPTTAAPPPPPSTSVAATLAVTQPRQPATTPVPVPPPATVPAGVTVRAIGDSVMVSAAGALQERLGSTGFIDAELSRQFVDGIAVARSIREQGGANVVVVHLGNNGPVEPATIDALLAELVDVPTVLLVNIRVSAAWRDSVNQALADAVARHPSTRLVDWYGASEGHADWFQSDGTHFRTTSGPGANAFAEVIARGVSAEP